MYTRASPLDLIKGMTKRLKYVQKQTPGAPTSPPLAEPAAPERQPSPTMYGGGRHSVADQGRGGPREEGEEARKEDDHPNRHDPKPLYRVPMSFGGVEGPGNGVGVGRTQARDGRSVGLSRPQSLTAQGGHKARAVASRSPRRSASPGGCAGTGDAPTASLIDRREALTVGR